MAMSRVYVSKGGYPCKKKKVVLGFSGGQADGFTDDQGYANIEHSARGEATVYVDGRARGTFRAPGNTAVNL